MLARVGRSFATVALVGALSFAMPIAAQADVNPVPLGQLVLGAVRAAAPAEAAASVVGPEGTLIVSSVVALGALAYFTRDTWMPWAAGLFGAGGTQAGADPAGVAAGNCQLWSPPVVNTSPGGVVALTLTNTCSAGVYQRSGENITIQCRIGSSYATQIYDASDVMAAGASSTYTLQCSSLGSATYVGTSPTPGVFKPTANQVSWGAQFDPYAAATYQVNVTCRKADGSSAVITATTTNPGNPAVVTSGPGGGGLLVPSCAAQWANAHAEGMAVTGAASGAPQRALSSQTFPSTSTLYPNCVGGGVACTYVVTYLGAPCVVGQAECVAWAVRAQVAPQDYGCLFGSYVMTLAQCAVDERVYEPNGVVLTKLNTDGDPNTYDRPAPAWAPAPAPAPAPGAPGGAPAPVTGTQTPTTTTQTNNSDCWPSGAAVWNPADWVLTPVKCALTWAFVPSTSVLTTLSDTAKADFTSQGLGPIAAAVTANVSKVGGGSGCDGPAVTFSAVGVVKPMHPFSACTAPMSTLAGISYAVTTVVVVLGGGWAALVAVGAGFGFNVKRGAGVET